MVNIHCPVQGCTYQTGDFPASVVGGLLQCHSTVHGAAAAVAAAAATRPRLPKVDRPTLTDDMDEESWNVFELGWDI